MTIRASGLTMPDWPILVPARIHQGRLDVDLSRVAQAVRGAKDGPLTVVLERFTARRSLEQNALYHAGYVKPLAEYTGYTPLEMHRYLKRLFLPAVPMKRLTLCDRHGEIVDEVEIEQEPTTTTLTIEQFTAYLREIEGLAATLGVTVGSNRGEDYREPAPGKGHAA